VIFLDVLLLVGATFLPIYKNTGTVDPNIFHLIFFVTWLFLSIALGKFRFTNQRLQNEIIAILLNGISILGLLSLYVISLERYTRNYNILYRQVLIVVAIELICRLTYYIINHKKYSRVKQSFTSFLSLRKKKWSLMFLDLLSMAVAFMFIIWIKPATMRFYLPNYTQFIIILLIWEFFLNLLTQKHQLRGKKRYRDYIFPILKSNLFTLIVLGIVIYVFGFFNLSRLVVFGTIALATVFEIIIVLYLGVYARTKRNTDVSERIIGVTPLEEKKVRLDDVPYEDPEDLDDQGESVRLELKENLSEFSNDIFEFIDKEINLKGIRKSKSTLLKTKTRFNVSALPDNSQELLINLEKVNDFNRINDYFALLNKKVKMGGYIVGTGETIKAIYLKLHRKYPRLWAQIIFFMHFIVHRVLPKLPISREINYLFTGGRKRTMSKAEILGRIVYSGFQIVETIKINDMLFFIAVKVNVPYEGENPSYGPIISLKRVGKNGKIIKVYKMRTMHPYSEYIQDYVYKTGGGTIDGDGFMNDFRITGWGKFFRKVWIDEIPMIINWIRGEMKLVGVRPLSEHKYSILDDDLKKLRIQFLPGLVPPFYVDLPNNLEEIQESERKYLQAYSKHKISTDIKYFFKAFYNIIFKKARSK
jgi:lipopolysaccharide/colanic/teichoic acid biosynthesis glycosyltransferase